MKQSRALPPGLDKGKYGREVWRGDPCRRYRSSLFLAFIISEGNRCILRQFNVACWERPKRCTYYIVFVISRLIWSVLYLILSTHHRLRSCAVRNVVIGTLKVTMFSTTQYMTITHLTQGCYKKGKVRKMKRGQRSRRQWEYSRIPKGNFEVWGLF